MKRALITGASGFIGQVLVRQLQSAGAQIRALVRSHAPAGHIEIRHGDLLKPGSLAGCAEGMSTVVHLAAYAHATSRHGPQEIQTHRAVNLEGTKAIFQEAVKSGVQCFVYISSVKAGGESPHTCLDELDERHPTDPYGQIKRQTEEFLLSEGPAAGIRVSIIRPALVYGPGMKGNLAALLRMIDRGLFPPIPDTGNRRSMVDVRDLVDAIIAASERPQAGEKAYIISDGEAYSTRRIYLAMCEALGKKPRSWAVPAWVFRGMGRVGDLGERLIKRELPYNSTIAARLLDSACYNSVLAATGLGFQPRFRFEDALPEIVAHYRQTA